MPQTYSIGLDFGTLSARAMLVDNSNGSIVATSVFGYQNAVIDITLPNTSIALPDNYALQDPHDYVEAVEGLISDVWRKGKVKPEQVVGIGVAFTACTMMPVDESMEPLCFKEEYCANPHAWVKLWKHHGAQEQADHINQLAQDRNEHFIRRYGNKSSSEWMFAKILNTLEEAPEIYEKAYRFVECGDWIVYLLTGNYKKNSCTASYKAFWSVDEGYPSKEFFKALNPRMENVIEEKIGYDVYEIGTRAGKLSARMAEITGLTTNTCVGVANTDAHPAIPAVGLSKERQLLLIMGTSLCQILISKKNLEIPGINGCVKNGVLPGYYGIEAGQSAVGDIYDWFVNNCIPYEYVMNAEKQDVTLFDVMNEKAAEVRPGESGLLALDWWNGNRSMLVDSDLTGLLLGMTLTTKPEEIYRSLIESTAFGTRFIIESFEGKGISIDEVFACGGLSRKSEVVMQIFSDVIGKEISVSAVAQTSALGAAMYGAIAAGAEGGGHCTIFDAVAHMSGGSNRIYKPNMNNFAIYTRLFEEYKKLHDLFGKTEVIMKNLLEIKRLVHR